MPKRGEAVVAGVRLTHPERVLWKDQGVTKLALARYYVAIAPRILPHLAGRPLVLVRCPGGSEAECFYHKHVERGFPDAVGRIEVEEGGAKRLYAAVEDAAGLVGLVQMSVLEIHPWGSRKGSLENPDRMFFDLDPGPDVDWATVIDSARELQGLLEALGLRSFAKTTGGKGFHVVCPLDGKNDWDEVKSFSRALVLAMEDANPERYVSVMTKSKRQGRIYVDYLRNARGATAVAPYSTRARPGAPTSVPVAWSEVPRIAAPNRFNVDTLPRRIARLRRDPWAGFFATEQRITAAMMGALGIG